MLDKKHSVGKTIATLRKAKGLTQVELAEKLQVSDKAVSKWEKDDSFPSIEFFPALAELFNVSIDYLITGKAPEKEIILMSQLEYCAKTDDPSFLSNINLKATDENGKTILNYVKQYESYNVFSAICDKDPALIKKMDFETAFKFSLIANRIDILKKDIISCLNFQSSNFMQHVSKAGIKNLFHIEDKSYTRYIHDKTLCCISDDMLDIIVTNTRINDDTMQYILSKHDIMTSVWYQMFPYLIHQSYLHNNTELLNKILEISIGNNQYAYEKYKGYYDTDCLLQGAGNLFAYSDSYFDEGRHGLVRILEKTIKLALMRGDFELVEKFNEINSNIMNHYRQSKCYIANSDEIRVAKLKQDKNVGDDEIAIQSAIHYEIICVDELFNVSNLELAKKALNEYPITVIDWAYNLIKSDNWSPLLQFAIDNKFNRLAKIISTTKKEDDILEFLWSTIYQTNYSQPDMRQDIRYQLYSLNEKYLNPNNNYGSYFPNSIPHEEFTYIINYLQKCKEQIALTLEYQFNKNRDINDLTKNYFETELQKCNFEIVIIKLCKRLEAILKYDYHYEGGLSNMLELYCNKYLKWQGEDGWESDDKTIKALRKLVIQRNSIAHADKCSSDISLEEIKYCINYICKMG